MESAFAWIGNLMEWVGTFIPRVKIVRSTHAGVRFRHGKHAKAVKPGLCVYWPIVTEVEIIPVARQTHNLPSQSLLTKDGKQVVAGGVVVYEIKDIVATMARNWDVADTINDITMVAITDVITTHELAYLLANLTQGVQDELTRVTRKKLKHYGVKVFRTALTDFSTALVVKNIGGGGTILTHNQE
jgi:regulator of protease activity HflC (stomatin/prohibitin superfamily)